MSDLEYEDDLMSSTGLITTRPEEPFEVDGITYDYDHVRRNRNTVCIQPMFEVLDAHPATSCCPVCP